MTTQLNLGGPRRAATARKQSRRVVVASIPSDSHTWNLVALQLLLEEMGYEVVNLGPCTPVDLLLRRCRAERPDCVVISTINGHGHIDGEQVITALRADPDLAGLTVVIGGKLDTRAAGADLADHLVRIGYDAVFPTGPGEPGDLDSFRDFLALRVGLAR